MYIAGRARRSSFAVGCIGAPIAAILSILTLGLLSGLRNDTRGLTAEQLAYQAAERRKAQWVGAMILLLLAAMILCAKHGL